MTLPTQLMKTLKWPTQLPTLMQNHSGGDSVTSIYIIPDPPTSPSLISLNGFCGRKAQSFQAGIGEPVWPSGKAIDW